MKKPVHYVNKEKALIFQFPQNVFIIAVAIAEETPRAPRESSTHANHLSLITNRK